MPSGITHMFLVRDFLNKPDHDLDSDLKMKLAAGLSYFQTGAVGPDLPYASSLDSNLFSSETEAADLFHYNLTNKMVLEAFTNLKPMKSSLSGFELDCAFAFFLGYASHIIADGVMHPFVRDKVGDYEDNKTAHRILEMKLDVILVDDHYKHITPRLNLNFTNVHDELLNIIGDANETTRKVLTFFSNAIKSVYALSYDVDDIIRWIKALHGMLGFAEGDHPYIYRYITSELGLTFKNASDLADERDDILNLTKPIDREVNFLNRPSIHFIDDCIPRFHAKFHAFSNKAYLYIYQNGPALTPVDLPEINLDTGRYISNNKLEEIPALWA